MRELTDAECAVLKIIAHIDRSRMDTFGGYPSQYVIENDRVYWADYDSGKDHLAVTLDVYPINEFIRQFAHYLDEEEVTE